MHFIDDRLETVKGVAADAALREAGLRVYFAEWCASYKAHLVAITVVTWSQPAVQVAVSWRQPCIQVHLDIPLS